MSLKTHGLGSLHGGILQRLPALMVEPTGIEPVIAV